jgi:hypothetical protein
MIGSDGLPQEATRRLQAKKQTLDDAYAAPANFLEIDVVNPITHGIARNRYTDYEVRMRVSVPQTHPSLHSFIHLFIHSSIHLFIHSFIHLFN